MDLPSSQPEPQRMTITERARWLNQVDNQCDILAAAAHRAGMEEGTLVFKYPNGVTIECTIHRRGTR